MKVRVIGFKASFVTGVLELTAKQAAVRSHCLKHLEGNKYQVLFPVEFKAGEEFGFNGELSKGILESLEEIEESPKRGRKPKADGEGEE